MARYRKVSEKWVKEHFGEGELISSAAQRLQEATAATTELQGIVSGAAAPPAEGASSAQGSTAEELTVSTDDRAI